EPETRTSKSSELRVTLELMSREPDRLTSDMDSTGTVMWIPALVLLLRLYPFSVLMTRFPFSISVTIWSRRLDSPFRVISPSLPDTSSTSNQPDMETPEYSPRNRSWTITWPFPLIRFPHWALQAVVRPNTRAKVKIFLMLLFLRLIVYSFNFD